MWIFRSITRSGSYGLPCRTSRPARVRRSICLQFKYTGNSPISLGQRPPIKSTAPCGAALLLSTAVCCQSAENLLRFDGTAVFTAFWQTAWKIAWATKKNVIILGDYCILPNRVDTIAERDRKKMFICRGNDMLTAPRPASVVRSAPPRKSFEVHAKHCQMFSFPPGFDFLTFFQTTSLSYQ